MNSVLINRFATNAEGSHLALAWSARGKKETWTQWHYVIMYIQVYHILVILHIFETFSLLLYLSWWSVMLEKTLGSLLDCKAIQPVHPKGHQSWVFIGKTDSGAETPILRPPHWTGWLIGKDSDAGSDWGQEEKGMTEDERAGWRHQLDAHESGWTPGVGDGQGGLACCVSLGHKESDTTERLNLTEAFLRGC